MTGQSQCVHPTSGTPHAERRVRWVGRAWQRPLGDFALRRPFPHRALPSCRSGDAQGVGGGPSLTGRDGAPGQGKAQAQDPPAPGPTARFDGVAPLQRVAAEPASPRTLAAGHDDDFVVHARRSPKRGCPAKLPPPIARCQAIPTGRSRRPLPFPPRRRSSRQPPPKRRASGRRPRPSR